jgi:hypothetical protein
MDSEQLREDWVKSYPSADSYLAVIDSGPDAERWAEVLVLQTNQQATKKDRLDRHGYSAERACLA